MLPCVRVWDFFSMSKTLVQCMKLGVSGLIIVLH